MGPVRRRKNVDLSEEGLGQAATGSSEEPAAASSMTASRPVVQAVPYSGRFSALLDPTNDRDEDDVKETSPPTRADEGPAVAQDRRGKRDRKAKVASNAGPGAQEGPRPAFGKEPATVAPSSSSAPATKGHAPAQPRPAASAPTQHASPAHPPQRQPPSKEAPAGRSAGVTTANGHSGKGRKGTVCGDAGKHGDAGGAASGGKRHRRRGRLWRIMQWLLVLLAVGMAALITQRRLLEDTPLSSVSEFLPEGLSLPVINVTIPSLSLSLPKPSLESLMSSTGLNASLLLAITDTLTDTLHDITDTLNDLTDSISGGGLSMSAQLRTLLSQLPAFSMPQLGGTNASSTAGRPGLAMARQGYRAKHPVVIVPGFVTSGLELWRGLPCGQRYFRQRMWGTLAMVQAFLTDPSCWFRHMELDPITGLDPEGIKVRAAVGLEAVDYFIQGYWVWGKLVEALADVGYDSNSLVSMPYDWRLAMPLLEERDGYFTRLRSTMEALLEVNGERVVIATHSYGENVVRSFMSWVESDEGSEGWVERHIAAVINIAGTSLGVPKSVSALLSGETRDTAQLGALAGFLTSNLVPRAIRTRMWRTWGASYAMLPVGGPRVWGNITWAPDDTPEMRAAKRTYGAMVALWPHNWQTVMAAASAASAAQPQQRDQIKQLVVNVSQAADDSVIADSNVVEDANAVAASAEDVATAAVDPAAATGNRNNSGSANVTSPTRSPNASSSGSGSSPMSRITDTLKKLVSSSGADVHPVDHLDSEQVTRLDVTGFVDLLREVGGTVVDQHTQEWGAADLSGSAAGRVDSAAREKLVSGRASRAADRGGAPAEQAAGGPHRLRRTARGDSAAGEPAAARRRLPLFPDATHTPLPNAPSTTVVCLYGVGIPTERGYHYLRPPPSPPSASPGAATAVAGAVEQTAASGQPGTPPADAEAGAQDSATSAPGSAEAEEGLTAAEAGSERAGGATGTDSAGDEVRSPPHDPEMSGEEASPDAGSEAAGGWMIMKDVSQPEHSLDVGVHLGDGDGTVPLISLGLMCRGGWRPGSRLNPAGMRVVTREFKHRSVSMLQDARGGPATAAHIDILGNEAVLHDVIRVVAGRVAEMEDSIVSDIDRIAAQVDLS